MTQTRTALLAAVMLGMVRAHWIVGQFLALATLANSRFLYVGQLLGNVLFLLPLPFTLILIYRSGTNIAPSTSLRRLALATAFVLGIVFTAPALYGLSRAVLREWSYLGWFEGTAVAPRLWDWFKSSIAQEMFWGFVIQLSQVAVVLFLLTLGRSSGNAARVSGSRLELLKRAAMLATIAAGAAVVLNIVGQVSAAREFAGHREETMWLGGPTQFQFILRNAFNGILGVCWLMIPLIIYRSLVREPPSEHAGAACTLA